MSESPNISRRHMLKNMGILVAGSSLVGPAESLAKLSLQQKSETEDSSGFHTFSIVAFDPKIQAWGVAVSSKAPAVGAVVPYLGISSDDEENFTGGAIASQAFPDVLVAPMGLQILLDGGTAQEALDAILTETITERIRQFGIVDSQGGTAAYTGSGNPTWAGHIEGDNFTVQGNTLAGPEVLNAMSEFYASSDEDFWYRLLNTLKVGEEAGGDRRQVGKDAVANSAAIKIVGNHRSILGVNTNLMDLRVDDHSNPIDELERIMGIWLSFLRPSPIKSR